MTAPHDALQPVVPLRIDEAAVPPADPSATPAGYLVTVDAAVRIHFLDWGGPADPLPGPAAAEPATDTPPAIVLIHGIAQTAAIWAPVARRLRAVRRVLAMDLRGHGLSDAPTHGYDAATLGEDVEAVIEASGAPAGTRPGVVLVGHGFGGIVAAWAAERLGDRCAGLVLVDGGWEDAAASTGLAPDELLRTMEEPPEVLRSMGAYLADRAGFDPATWDADQQAAARAAVVEVPAGKVVLGVRPHALAASVEAMFAYRPTVTFAALSAPVVAVVGNDEDGSRHEALRAAARTMAAGSSARQVRVVHLPGVGHNLMRYRPAGVAAAILAAG